jgi:hypothetical protein
MTSAAVWKKEHLSHTTTLGTAAAATTRRLLSPLSPPSPTTSQPLQASSIDGLWHCWAACINARLTSLKRPHQLPAASATSHHARDRKLRTQAKKEIWDTKAPLCTWVAYNAWLKRSRRWYKAAETLGWDILVLTPSDTITPHWVEQTLRAGEWNIWLQLVQHVNPAAIAASHDFDAWLGPPGIEHGSLKGASTLTIKAVLPYRITKIPKSEIKIDAASLDGSSDDEHNEDGHNGHSITSVPSLASAAKVSVGAVWRHEKVERIVIVFRCLHEESIYNVGASFYRLAAGRWDER